MHWRMISTLALALWLPGLTGAQTIGPDIIVSEIDVIHKWGTFLGITAYSFSTTSCNLGDVEAQWLELTDQHPVIAMNMYRYRNGRFAQIGLSWLKHGFCALSLPDCGTCIPTPCETLGVGCSDTYGSTLNGNQTGLGPRYEVNPATGEFPYPFDTIGITGPVLYKRIQVNQSDLNPALNPDASYFYEAQYIHPEEPFWSTQYNNVSYREFEVGALDADGYDLEGASSTVQELPAIYAWQDLDPGVDIDEILVPGDGKLFVGSRATDLGAGQWHYEYAIYNMNSDRAAGSFSVSSPPGSTVTNVDFRDISYHSGEPFAGTNWSFLVQPNRVVWSTETFTEDENANAVRWGTLYNFGFDCDVAPSTSDLIVGLFKPGPDSSQTLQAVGPGESPCSTPDFVRGNVNGDAGVDVSDAVYLLTYLFQMGAAPVPIVEAGDANADTNVDVADGVYLLAYLFQMGPEPPFPFPDPGCL